MQKRNGISNTGYVFPSAPSTWTDEEKQFGQSLRRMFDQLFQRLRNIDEAIQKNKKDFNDLYPVGIIVLTVEHAKPFSFGTWAELDNTGFPFYIWERRE